MKKLSKKLLAVLLVIVMLVPTGVMTITSSAVSQSSDIKLNIYAVNNYTTSDSNYGPLLIYGDSAQGLGITNAFSYWMAIVVECDSTGKFFVSRLNTTFSTESSSEKHNLSASSTDGFVIFVWGGYYNFTTAYDNISVGNAVMVDFNYKTTTADTGKILGTVSFINSSEQYPDGYDFYEDSYNFENYTCSTLSKKYFTTMYGTEQGKLLYKKYKNVAANGLCFGMAYTTAAIYNNFPAANTIYSIGDAVVFNNLRQANTESKLNIGGKTISIDDYIKYAFVYQCSDEQQLIKNATRNNINQLFSVVQSFLNNEMIGITISLSSDTYGGHRVLAVGIDGNDILIDDPNNTDSVERLTINNNGSWSFSGGNWNSNNSDISYTTDIQRPYQILKTGKTTTATNALENNSDNTVETYVEGMNKLGTDKLLLSVDCETYSISNTSSLKIELDAQENADSVYANDIYWISEDKTVTVLDITGEDNEIVVAGNDVSICVNTQDNSVVTLTVDEENAGVSANIDSTQGNEYSVIFETTDDLENDLITTITGTASGDEVTATETDNGIQVTGLNNITVTYETADGTDTVTANITDGRTMNIVADDASNSVAFDWNCSHLCHSTNSFMQFIWKIAKFICRIFGTNQYCDCGMAHW